MEYENLFNSKDENVLYRKKAIEAYIDTFDVISKSKKITIPLVFHVLYKKGAAMPDEKQIESQIIALNKQFKLKGYKSKHEAATKERFEEREADIEIDFCLARYEPSGKATTGIEYIESSLEINGLDNSMKQVERGGVNPWKVSDFVNIWVCNLPDSISGYAQMPWGDPQTDGIVIDGRFLGTEGTAKFPYNEGKTLTHLIGNYLGLYDLWGPCQCCDDGVEDTPIHNAPNFGKVDLYKHVSLCNGNPVEMSINFMDNTDDAWMEMFTAGQKKRMQAILSQGGPRAYLAYSNGSCKDNVQENSQRNINAPSISVFPNPATTEINLSIIGSGETRIDVIDIIGRSVFHKVVNIESQSYEENINSSTWAKGIYNVEVLTENKLLIANLIIQ